MIPKTLYKFRDWNDPLHQTILTKNEIFFSSAVKFNDPFDTAVHLNYRSGTDEQFRSLFKKIASMQWPDATDKEIDNEANIRIESGIYRNPEVFDEFENYLQKEKYTGFGIFTMSASFDNILLWSHYANSHKGFCVGLSTGKLDNYFENLAETEELVIDIYPVVYEKDYPDLNGFEIEKDEDAVVSQFTIKPIDWSYEIEYRALCLNATNFSYSLENGIIEKVILGCRISEAHKTEIIRILSKQPKKVELLQARKRKREFILEFEKIEYV